MYELKQVDKHFPGIHALKSVDFAVNRGEIVGLVGENGAGKSTLMKVIYGAYQPDGGNGSASMARTMSALPDPSPGYGSRHRHGISGTIPDHKPHGDGEYFPGL